MLNKKASNWIYVVAKILSVITLKTLSSGYTHSFRLNFLLNSSMFSRWRGIYLGATERQPRARRPAPELSEMTSHRSDYCRCVKQSRVNTKKPHFAWDSNSFVRCEQVFVRGKTQVPSKREPHTSDVIKRICSNRLKLPVRLLLLHKLNMN